MSSSSSSLRAQSFVHPVRNSSTVITIPNGSWVYGNQGTQGSTMPNEYSSTLFQETFDRVAPRHLTPLQADSYCQHPYATEVETQGRQDLPYYGAPPNWTVESDEHKVQRISDFYIDRYGPSAFASAFLSDSNLLGIQYMLTQAVISDLDDPRAIQRVVGGNGSAKPCEQVASVQDNPSNAKIPFTDQIVGGLLSFAYQMRGADGAPQTVNNGNLAFTSLMSPGLVVEYGGERTRFMRWSEQGLPDPNVIPLPIQSEKRDMTIDTSGYILSHPWNNGGHHPRW